MPVQNETFQSIRVEELKEYRAVIQALGNELREAQRDRHAQATVSLDIQGKLQMMDEKQKELGDEAKKGLNAAREGWAEEKKARLEAKKGWEEVKKATEETRLAR